MRWSISHSRYPDAVVVVDGPVDKHDKVGQDRIWDVLRTAERSFKPRAKTGRRGR